MDIVDDLIFSDFVANNLSHDEMVEVERTLIDSGEADASIYASMAYYSLNGELADELLGEDENLYTNIDRIYPASASIITKTEKTDDMSKKPKLAPGVAAAAGVAAHRLFRLYKSGSFDFFNNRNVASSVDVLNNNDMEKFDKGMIASSTETAGSVGYGETAGSIGHAQAETTHGKPALDIEFDPETYQYYPDTCALQSQAMILREYGYDVTQEDLMQIAKENGWYVEGYGTPEDKVGKLLEYFGVDTTTTEGNNVFNLANELAQGHRVMVTVDAGELWMPGEDEEMEDLMLGEKADHALLVVGVDTSDPDNVQVIVTDPGNGNTQYSYSAKEFMEAWKDSNCFMTTTNESPEEHIEDIDYPPMPVFGGIPYDMIERLSESDLSIEDVDSYHEFYEDFMNNPHDLDALISEYSDLFDGDDDDVDFGDDSE